MRILRFVVSTCLRIWFGHDLLMYRHRILLWNCDSQIELYGFFSKGSNVRREILVFLKIYIANLSHIKKIRDSNPIFMILTVSLCKLN